MSIKIQAKESESKASQIRVRAQVSDKQPDAEFKALPPAMAHFKALRDAPKPYNGKVGICSAAMGARVKIDTRAKPNKRKNLDNRIQTVFKLAREHIEKTKDADAKEVKIHIRPDPDAKGLREIVTISYKDHEGRLCHVSSRDVPKEILDRANKISSLIGKRSLVQRDTPLQTSVKEVFPKTYEEFIEVHLPKLKETLDPPLQEKALGHIQKTEQFINISQRALQQYIGQKEKELESVPLLPANTRKGAEDDLKELKKLAQMLQDIDRYAVFYAVASWGDLDTGEMTHDTRQELKVAANRLSQKVKQPLAELEEKRAKTHWFQNSWVGRHTPFVPKYEPSTEQNHDYAMQIGDLLLPDRWEKGLRADENERLTSKASIEELIVQIMLNLENKEVLAQPNSPILSHLREETQQGVLAYLKMAKDHVNNSK